MTEKMILAKASTYRGFVLKSTDSNEYKQAANKLLNENKIRISKRLGDGGVVLMAQS